MGLADEIKHPDIPQDLTTGQIPIHLFTGALVLYIYGEATANQIDTVFGITARGVRTGLDQVIAQIDALSTEAEKLRFAFKAEGAGNFYEKGSIDKIKYKSIMGLTD